MNSSNRNAWICDVIRTPIGRYGGALASVRADDLAVGPIKALMQRNSEVDWSAVDDVIFGCTNQAGEDCWNVARNAALIAGLPETIPGITVNRLCASGADAVATAARNIIAGEADLCLAGGVESMSRAPYVMPKAGTGFDRMQEIADTTLGSRFPHPKMQEISALDPMPNTGERVAEQFRVSREDQDAFAFRSQQRYQAAAARGYYDDELTPVTIPQRRKDSIVVDKDEHPRPDTTMESLAQLRPYVKADGTLTAGNSSGINDGGCALLVASDDAVSRYGLKPMARVVSTVAVGVSPRIMGIGPAPAVQRLLERTGVALGDIDVIELNEAFAAQSLAVLRELGIPDDADHVNPNGGAIAIGHPLGMSGARLVATAARQLVATDGRYAIATMCVGIGQGVAMLMERVR